MNTGKKIIRELILIGVLNITAGNLLAQEYEFKPQKLEPIKYSLQIAGKKFEPITVPLVTKLISKKESGSLINISNHPSVDCNPSISADGSIIAFTSNRDGNLEVYIANLEEKNLTNISNYHGVDNHPSISADGSIIAFKSKRDQKKDYNSEVYIANLKEKTLTHIINSISSRDEPISISGDGNIVAFMSNGERNSEIYIADIKEKTLVNISNNPATDQCPSISEDGTKVAFESERDGNFEVYVADLVAKTLTNVSNNKAWDGIPEIGYYDEGVWFMSQRNGRLEIYNANPSKNIFKKLEGFEKFVNLSTKPAISKDVKKMAFLGTIEKNLEIYLVDNRQ